MVPAVDACPSEDALLACLEAQRISELAEHLDACDQCREVVAVLGRGSSEPLPALGEVPARIGRFVIEQRLGAGAMGVVYLAHDPRLERRVALKVLRDDMPAAELLIEEARAMARIEHDNLAVVYEVEQVGDRVAIAMEHLPGGTLRAWLKTRRTWRETVSVMAGVARGLAAIHAAGIAHRDLKPDNILFDLTGRPRIADFGLATQPTATTTTSVIGTPAYMAPEQLAGAPADAASDQWSFFVCLFEALTGSRPFRGSTPAELRAHMLATRAPRVVGPRKLQALVARGLAVDAGSRHPSMSWVAETLGQMRLSRRAVPALVAFAGISVVAVLMTSTGERDNAAPCDRSRDRIAEVWNAGEAARITAVFGKAGMIDTASIVTRGLERYADAWAVGQRASCEATHVQQVQSETLLDRRTICLEERLAHVEVLVQALSGDDRGVLARAGEAVAMLPPIADCADLAALVRTPRPVTPDPVARERGRQAWLEIARVHALASLHDVSVRTRVEPILATATALRDHALEAEARLVIADALSVDLQLAPARVAFAKTELAAEAGAHDDLRARALIAHATLVGARQQDPAGGTELLAHARAVIARLGVRPDLDRRVLVAEAAIALARGDATSGERLLRRSLETLPETGPEGVLRTTALRNLASVLGEQGRHREALVAARQALALAETLLGPGHLDVAETWSMLALALHFVGDEPNALAAAIRALTTKQHVLGPDHVGLSSTIMVRAVIERDSSRVDGHAAARTLTDRAIVLRRAGYGADSPLTLTLVSERGSLAVDAGEHAIARASFAAALPGLERAWGAGSPAVTQARQGEALMAERAGEFSSCAHQLSEVAAVIRRLDGPASPRLGEVGLHRIRCSILAGALTEAATALAQITVLELSSEERSLHSLLEAWLAIELGATSRVRSILTKLDTRTWQPALELELAGLWGRLKDPRAWAHVEHATHALGEDLTTAELWFRAAGVARTVARPADADRFATRALALAITARAGPDTLARYRSRAPRKP